MDYLCAICQKPYYPKDVKEHFCNNCWHTYNSEIMSGADWIKLCVNSEIRRRRSEQRDSGKLIYLGDNDLTEVNGEYQIVYKYKEEGEE